MFAISFWKTNAVKLNFGRGFFCLGIVSNNSLYFLFTLQDKLMTFSDGKDDLTDKIDFIVCLGGDGTLLYASSLFQQSVPPVMAFHLGSLGFLTPFEVDNFEQQITHVLEGNS